MSVALTLLDDVRWHGTAVPGARPQALLAALAAGEGRSVPADRLVDLVWNDDVPANGPKSLQVLVSRTRTVCGAGAIVRDATGYRLGIDPLEIDCVLLADRVRRAAAALESDPDRAAALAREALAIASGAADVAGDDADPLAAARLAAAGDVARAKTVLAQASSRMGAHEIALSALEDARSRRPDDEGLLADLLRSEAAVRGPSAALERYERYRRDLRERLGSSPGERLRRVQRELLALDRPVRTGIRYDATSLVGRDRDLERLRALLATARVVSIVGAGGLGKTRLAHVLARDAAAPTVHVVELAGVTSADDVVGEVGSALDVRDSVSTRRTLTAEQRADVRARIAQRLAQSPALLVLDNCEHLVDTIAELVAFLVSSTADLRVLTTSRAPLAIAAERVYALGELNRADAIELFDGRARSARPDAELPRDAVETVVARLDGLPLAIELAAAKVRVMAVREIERRLGDRFTLLRGGDRSAPDRHQTLLAVIEWSWDLLAAPERRALARLALFNDGFTLPGAEAVVGDAALEAVQGLIDQSLVAVRDAGGARYRMLETVREFGRMKLRELGDEEQARAARRSWAVAYAQRHRSAMLGEGQLAAVGAIAAEEINLADEMRDALADDDIGTMVELLAALGTFWTIRGEHVRLIAALGAIAEALRDWRPPPELERPARAAVAVVLTNAIAFADARVEPLHGLLERLGPGDDDPRLAGVVTVLLEFHWDRPAEFVDALERLAAGADPHVALPALQWLGNARENEGDPVAALDAAQRALALARDEEGPWTAAIMHAHIADLAMSLGDHALAEDHARAALPAMQRLGARDDEVQLRSLLAIAAILDGRLSDAEQELDLADALDERQDVFGGVAFRQIGRAEVAFARGELADGLRTYRACAVDLAELHLPGLEPTWLEPWGMFGEAAALAAHAHHAHGDEDVAHGRRLFASCRARTLTMLDQESHLLDFPVAGLALFSLGAWTLLRDEADAAAAVELLALAQSFAYARRTPTVAWDRIEPAAQERAPGLIAELCAGLDGTPAPQLVGRARALVDALG